MRIIFFIEDEQLVKKILKHLDLWDVRRKPPARAHGPPPETFIIYDKLSSLGADDYIIDADYPIETYLKKNPAPAIPVSYVRIRLIALLQVKKSKLTISLDTVMGLRMGCI